MVHEKSVTCRKQETTLPPPPPFSEHALSHGETSHLDKKRTSVTGKDASGLYA